MLIDCLHPMPHRLHGNLLNLLRLHRHHQKRLPRLPNLPHNGQQHNLQILPKRLLPKLGRRLRILQPHLPKLPDLHLQRPHPMQQRLHHSHFLALPLSRHELHPQHPQLQDDELEWNVFELLLREWNVLYFVGGDLREL
jgi:hypothetical protein